MALHKEKKSYALFVTDTEKWPTTMTYLFNGRTLYFVPIESKSKLPYDSHPLLEGSSFP